jgi:DNA adenine methylase
MARKPTDLASVTKTVMAALDGSDLGDDQVRVVIELVEEPLSKEDATVEKALAREVPILKTEEERYVLGVVLEPTKEMNKADSQGDLYSADEVRQACHKFMEHYGVMGLQHKINVSGQVKVLENWIARKDEQIDGQLVKEGTWLMGIRVVDDKLWERVKSGSLTGFSIGGFARRAPVASPKN